MFVEGGGAVIVAQFAQAEQVVGKAWDDVSSACLGLEETEQ